MKLTCEKIVDFYHYVKPRMIFEMDKETFLGIRNLYDGNRSFAWAPEPNRPDEPGKLLGIPISISKDKCFQLNFLFPDGHSHAIKFNS